MLRRDVDLMLPIYHMPVEGQRQKLHYVLRRPERKACGLRGFLLFHPLSEKDKAFRTTFKRWVRAKRSNCVGVGFFLLYKSWISPCCKSWVITRLPQHNKYIQSIILTASTLVHHASYKGISHGSFFDSAASGPSISASCTEAITPVGQHGS